MATQFAVFIPDYNAATTAGFTGSLTSGGAASGDIALGKYRLFKVLLFDSTTVANTAVIRFALYNKANQGTLVPTGTSPILAIGGQATYFEIGPEYDTINLIATDNSTDVIKYTLLPLAKF